MLLAVFNATPVPVVLWMLPPVQVGVAIVQVPALPTMAKLPLVLVRTIPFVPPLAETLVSEIARGVVLLERVISTAGLPLVVTVPLGIVMVLVLSVASNPR